jgi:hypothetical protein
LLKPAGNGWWRAGPESQVILQRRLHLKLRQKGEFVQADFLERRLVRNGASIMLKVPLHPQRTLLNVAAEWQQTNGLKRVFGRNDFVAVDRQGRPVKQLQSAAFLTAKIKVPANSLLRFRWILDDHKPSFFPHLELHGPYPFEAAELRLSGEAVEHLEITGRLVDGPVLKSPNNQVSSWRNLQPATTHPWAPGALGQRAAWVQWKNPRHADLVEQLLSNTNADYQLRTLPSVGATAASTPCLLRPWGADALRPNNVMMTTANRLPEGGYQLNLPDPYRRPFADCTLVQKGPRAVLPVRAPRGGRILQIRTRVRADGTIAGKGRLSFSGAGADAVRRGSINMTQELEALLKPLKQGLRMGKAQVRGSGPVHVMFELRFQARDINPSKWLGNALPELRYLPAGEAIGPQTNHRQVEWVFDWPERSVPPPPTRMASASRGPLSASSTWSLGPQRSLRFVRSVRWQDDLFKVEPSAIINALQGIQLPATPLPTP